MKKKSLYNIAMERKNKISEIQEQIVIERKRTIVSVLVDVIEKSTKINILHFISYIDNNRFNGINKQLITRASNKNIFNECILNFIGQKASKMA